MRKGLLLWLLSFLTSSILFLPSVFAADLASFEVELNPSNAKVWEALDLKITAKDKNWATINNYNWNVLIFSYSNAEVTLPTVLKDSTYQFKDSDQWTVKFENWVVFTKAWKQDLTVVDLNDDKIQWKAEVTITEEWAKAKSNIEILSPDNWLTISETKVKVSWTTEKNHKVKIIINKTEESEVNSDANWVFEKEVTTLKNWENTIKAQILDADWKVIWETGEKLLKVQANSLAIKSLKILPEEVFVEWPYTIELITESWLKDANVVVNDSIINLKEESAGVYKWNSFAPKTAWNYKVDVNLSNDLGHKINELWVAVLKVKELNAALSNTWTTSTGNLNAAIRDPLKITWLKLVELKTKSILTWDKLDKAISYNVYKKNSSGTFDLITTVSEPRFEVNIEGKKVKYDDFYVSANGQDENGAYVWEMSDPTKIKTWPEMLIILIISLFFAWMFLFFKWKKA